MIKVNRKKLLLIYNPCAGKGAIRNKLSSLIEIFCNADYEVTVHATRYRNDATEIINKYGEFYDIIVCSGGDGTLNETVKGVLTLENKPAIGYIPTGTTNDCATSLALPKNMIDNAKTIVNGTLFPYDVGQINEDNFIYVAAFGAFTDVSYATSQSVKNILGRLAYLLEGAKRLTSLKSYHYKVFYDDVEIDDKFLYGMVSNSNSVGGFKGLNGKDVSLNDGLFEVTLITPPKNAFELQSIINALLSEEKTSKHVINFHTDKVRFVSDELVPWTVDGEFGGNYREANVVNLKHAVEFIVTKDDSKKEEI